MSSPYELKWGIISTGKIASAFVKDLLVDPKTRGTTDIIHRIVAVGSRSLPPAQSFIASFPSLSCSAYGTYEEVLADTEVQAIYIGTPHTHHYPIALKALQAGKAVLCEKPVTSNLAELEALLKVAKEKNVFFMEAMWTRFLPSFLDVLDELETSSRKVKVIQADLSGGFDVENIPTSHRILDPHLGGGAILDLGPYPLVWALCTINPSQPKAPSSISSSMLKDNRTGVDTNTSFTLNYSNDSQAILSCSINLNPSNPGALIRCEDGTLIEIHKPIYNPSKVVVKSKDGQVKSSKEYKYEGNGGWFFQADEVARCVKEGAIESGKWSWETSRIEMGIFDEVRKQGGYVLPEGVEWVKA